MCVCLVSCSSLDGCNFVQGYGLTGWLDGPGVAPQVAILLYAFISIFCAVAWIQLVASELVGALRACGLLIQCPPVLLGFTLAIVNSLGDLATNTSVARVSGKRAAFAACFSGQTFNLAMASLYGTTLYWARTHSATAPLRISGSTWLLWFALVLYAISLLATIGVSHVTAGAAELPRWAGKAARGAFAALVVLFWAVGLVKWL